MTTPSGRRRPPVTPAENTTGSTGSTHGESAVAAPAMSAKSISSSIVYLPDSSAARSALGDRAAAGVDHVPDAAELGHRLTEHLVGLVLVDVVVERVAVVGDLRLAVAALGSAEQALLDALTGARLALGDQRRPGARAVAVALALLAGLLGEEVQRAADASPAGSCRIRSIRSSASCPTRSSSRLPSSWRRSLGLHGGVVLGLHCCVFLRLHRGVLGDGRRRLGGRCCSRRRRRPAIAIASTATSTAKRWKRLLRNLGTVDSLRR